MKAATSWENSVSATAPFGRVKFQGCEPHGRFSEADFWNLLTRSQRQDVLRKGHRETSANEPVRTPEHPRSGDYAGQIRVHTRCSGHQVLPGCISHLRADELVPGDNLGLHNARRWFLAIAIL